MLRIYGPVILCVRSLQQQLLLNNACLLACFMGFFWRCQSLLKQLIEVCRTEFDCFPLRKIKEKALKLSETCKASLCSLEVGWTQQGNTRQRRSWCRRCAVLHLNQSNAEHCPQLACVHPFLMSASLAHTGFHQRLGEETFLKNHLLETLPKRWQS